MKVRDGLRYLSECFLAMATVLRAIANIQADDNRRIVQLETRVAELEALLGRRRR
jgi:uncharacterized protein YceH (UPF0502 family)